MSQVSWRRNVVTVAGWGLCYLLVVAAAALSNGIVPARWLPVAIWIIGACGLFGWSLRLAARSGALKSQAGVLLAVGTAILATAFFVYCGFTVIVMAWEFVGLGH